MEMGAPTPWATTPPTINLPTAMEGPALAAASSPLRLEAFPIVAPLDPTNTLSSPSWLSLSLSLSQPEKLILWRG